MNLTAEEILKEKVKFSPLLSPDETFKKVIEAMEEYANQSKWIRVEDSKPKKYGKYIVYRKSCKKNSF